MGLIAKISLIAFAATTLLLPFSAFAQEGSPVDPLKKVCKDAPNSTVCKSRITNPGDDASNPIYGRDGFLTKIINLLSIIVGAVAVFGIIVGGFRFITSGSNSQEVSNAREMVLYAIIALILAALAQAIVRFFLYRIN